MEPQSGIIIWIVHPTNHPPTQPPTRPIALVLKFVRCPHPSKNIWFWTFEHIFMCSAPHYFEHLSTILCAVSSPYFEHLSTFLCAVSPPYFEHLNTFSCAVSPPYFEHLNIFLYHSINIWKIFHVQYPHLNMKNLNTYFATLGFILSNILSIQLSV